MEIKGHRPHVFRVARGKAHIAHMALVDLVDRHVEADVVRTRAHDVLHDGVIGIAADLIVALPVAVQTQKDQIRFRKIDGKRTVRHDIHNEKAYGLRFDDQLSQRALAVAPEEGLAAAEEEDAHAYIIELLHLPADLFIWMDDCRDIIDRAVFAVQVAFVGQDHRPEDRLFFSQQDRLDAEGGKVQKRRWFHRFSPLYYRAIASSPRCSAFQSSMNSSVLQSMSSFSGCAMQPPDAAAMAAASPRVREERYLTRISSISSQ